MVDAPASKAGPRNGGVGSSPTPGTKNWCNKSYESYIIKLKYSWLRSSYIMNSEDDSNG